MAACATGHLVALAELLRLAPVEVFEVASFYHHFEVLEDAAPAPPPVTIRVCESLPCAMAGAHQLLDGAARRAAGWRARRRRALHGRLPPRARRGAGA